MSASFDATTTTSVAVPGYGTAILYNAASTVGDINLYGGQRGASSPLRVWPESTLVAGSGRRGGTTWQPQMPGGGCFSAAPWATATSSIGSFTCFDGVSHHGRQVRARTHGDIGIWRVDHVPGIDAFGVHAIAHSRSMPRSDMASETICFPGRPGAGSNRRDSTGLLWRPTASPDLYLCEDGRLCSVAGYGETAVTYGGSWPAYSQLRGSPLVDLAYLPGFYLFPPGFGTSFRETILGLRPNLSIAQTITTDFAASGMMTHRAPAWPATWDTGVAQWTIRYSEMYFGSPVGVAYFTHDALATWGAAQIYGTATTTGDWYQPGYGRLIGSL